MCSKTRQATAASKEPGTNGSFSASARASLTPPPRSAATSQLGPGRIDPGREGHAAEGGGPTAHLTLPTTHVQQAGRPGQMVGEEGQDLLLVLGVGALGEALLPPGRAVLPHEPAFHQANATGGEAGRKKLTGARAAGSWS